MADPRIERIRAELAREHWDAIVLTNTHDVVYSTGYSSIMEYWTLQEPICAAIVARDPAIPVVLVLPEANIALLAVAADAGRPDRAEELRLTELLTFCEMARAADPDAKPSAIGSAATDIFRSRVKGKTRSNVVEGITDALADHGLAGKRVAFDELRTWLWVQKDKRFAGYAPLDGVDAMVRWQDHFVGRTIDVEGVVHRIAKKRMTTADRGRGDAGARRPEAIRRRGREGRPAGVDIGEGGRHRDCYAFLAGETALRPVTALIE